MIFPFELWIFVAAGVIIAGVIVFTWQQRRKPVARAFLFPMICALVWVTGFIIETAAQSFEAKMLASQVQFLGIAFLPVGWLNLALVFTGWRRPKWFWLAAGAIPLATNFLVWVVPRPNWFWISPHIDTTTAPFPILRYDYAFWFYAVHAPYGYLCLLAALVVLLRGSAKMLPLYRQQARLLLTGMLLPALTDVLYVLGVSPIPHYNFTTAVFSLSGLLIFWALFRYHFLDLLPLARDVVIENMPDGVIVLDAKMRLVDYNPAARRIGMEASQLDGAPVTALVNRLRQQIEDMLHKGTLQASVEVGTPPSRNYDLQVSRVNSASGEVIGYVVTLRDITVHVQLFSQVQELALRDDLTGVHNRRYLMDFLNREMDRIRRHPERTVSAIMIDLDYLKQINDTFGHSAGDQALIAIASHCQSRIRSVDMIARLGGDEFAVILPDAGYAEAMEVANRILAMGRELRIPTELGELTLTLSMGVACSQSLSGALTAENLLDQADAALYRAKQYGRNRVVGV